MAACFHLMYYAFWFRLYTGLLMSSVSTLFFTCFFCFLIFFCINSVTLTLTQYFALENVNNRTTNNTIIWDKIFKSGPSKICGRQPLKNLKFLFRFLKGCLPQILLGPPFNTLSHFTVFLDICFTPTVLHQPM